MQNPLTRLELFPTPRTPDDLANVLNGIGSPDEVVRLYTLTLAISQLIGVSCDNRTIVVLATLHTLAGFLSVF